MSTYLIVFKKYNKFGETNNTTYMIKIAMNEVYSNLKYERNKNNGKFIRGVVNFEVSLFSISPMIFEIKIDLFPHS